jgi:FG-GAP-like repeat
LEEAMEKSRSASWVAGVVLLAVCAVSTVSAQNFAPPFEAACVVADSQTRFEGVLDYDGDGRMDAVSVLFPSTTTLRVRGYLNDGAGQLVPDWDITYPGVNPITLAGPKAVLATGDFNGDGLDDFALSLNYLLGYWISGGAGVVPSVDWGMQEPEYIKGILTDDFDGDGLTDVALLEGPVLGGATILRVFKTQQAAPPVLGSSTTFTDGGISVQIFRVEGNGDGLPDVGLIRSGGLIPSGAIAEIYPAPNCVLQLPVTFLLPSGYPGPEISGPMPVAGDIDGDGDVDVVEFGMSVGGQPAYYQVARRTGPATFSVESIIAGGPATNLVDLDGDGDLDGACCGGGGGPGSLGNTGASKFELSLNDGSGNFTPALEIAGLGATHLAGAVDLEGDGDIDLIAGRAIYYGRGAGGLPPYPGAPVTLGPRDVVDVDGDGDLDVKPGIGFTQFNRGDGVFDHLPVTAPAPPPTGTWSGPGFPGDFDGDGDVDILVDAVNGATLQAPFGTHLLLNLGSGVYVDNGLAVAPPDTMAVLSSSIPNVSENAENCVVADLDLDGDLDIVVRSTLGLFTNSAGNSKVWINGGAGTFVAGADLANLFVVTAGDMDQDGLVDLVAHQIASGSFTYLVILKRTPAGTYILPGAAGALPTVDNATQIANRPAIGDFDGDGDLDIFSTGTNFARLFVNQGNATFTTSTFSLAAPPAPNGFGNVARFALVADVDSDGLPDVVTMPLADVPNGMGILLNPMLNGPSPGTVLPIKLVFQPVAFGDVDGDGDADAISPFLISRNARFGPTGAGYRLQYGAGIPGSAGIVPIIGDVGPFRSGESGEIRIRGGIGGASGYLAIGLGAANAPLFGGALLVDPLWIFPIQLGGPAGVPGTGGLTIPWVMPASLVGLSLYHQAGFVDAGAAFGVSGTNGLRVDVAP